ncbi:MAG: DinB family protein [Candidatus Lokiarchaeota archaeon]|nr:DinB family protein [Candidatus Lokiarchaeota archaeon]
MSELKKVALWMFGNVKTPEGFWYSHYIHIIDGLSEEQLFWIPDPKKLPIIWHIGHIAHRERTHIGYIIQKLKGNIIPTGYEIFGTDWWPIDEIRKSIDSVKNVINWATEVRNQSQKFISSLDDEIFYSIIETGEEELSVAHWLFITASHTALHYGKIQLLRSLLENTLDSPC